MSFLLTFLLSPIYDIFKELLHILDKCHIAQTFKYKINYI